MGEKEIFLLFLLTFCLFIFGLQATVEDVDTLANTEITDCCSIIIAAN